ncbi:hypothetical protein [Methylobacterium sp. SyP6R]|uniref:hypothetical protein n=1 Tax=Methylobacterium sp. SyP6R TaxID=2718876 RepID=UPI001F1B4C83|nr:hypothetical protein [Methylobacterium sp. SyP6R]MCF4125308.1 hypothetical protein [Methylobacterium sp. SyP6R]
MDQAASHRHCSLKCLLAAASRVAVIYRRGPSGQTCLIRWDRAHDTFEIGQWFKGSVYPDRSSLAPDGEHLLTFMGSFRPPFSTWTVLSRPPYFTALALWPKGDTWGGGGTFLSDRTFALHHGAWPASLGPGFSMPEGFTLLPPGPAADERIARAASRDPQAWRLIEGTGSPAPTQAVTCDGPSGFRLLADWKADDPREPRRWERCVEVVRGDRHVPLAGVGWAAFDGTGDLLLARGGRLLRCMADDLPAAVDAGDVVARSRLLADFTDLTFRPLAAPYAAASHADRHLPVLDSVTKTDRQARKTMRRLMKRQAARSDG